MKKPFFSLAPLLIAVILFSCKKNNSTPEKIMTATVNGTRWVSSSVSDSTTDSTASIKNLYIVAKNDSGQIIKIVVPNFHNIIGAYYISGSIPIFKAYYYKNSVSYTAAVSGSLNISTINSSGIEGDFDLTTSDSTTIYQAWFTAPAL